MPLPPGRALPKLFTHLSVHADASPMLRFLFSLLPCEGSEDDSSMERTPCKMKTLQQRTFSHACPVAQRLKKPFDKSRAHNFSGQSRWWNLSWKTPCRQLCSFSLAPCQRAMHVPSPNVCTPLDKSWAHSFSAQSHWWNLSWKTRANSSALLALLPANKAMHLHTAWQVLGAQFLGTIALMKFSPKIPCQQLRILRAAPCQRSYACPIAQWLHAAWQVLGAQFLGTIALMEFVLKNPCQQLCSFSLAPCQQSYASPIAQCLHTAWQVLGAQFFGTIALIEFVLKNPCQQLCSFSLAPCQQSYAFAHRLTSLGRTVFRHNRIDGICPENPCQ